MTRKKCPHCGAKIKVDTCNSFHVWHDKYECGYEEVGALGESKGMEYKPCKSKQ